MALTKSEHGRKWRALCGRQYGVALTALTVCIMSLATPAQAGLTWERREAAATATPSDTQLDVVYPFKNTGDVPVSITSVRTSCGCTSATPDRTTYAPGEEGQLTASVHLGDRSGRQNYSIRVLTDDGGDAVILKLKATIPKLLEVSPRIIRWRKGADRTPQSTTIRVLHDEPIRVVKVACDDPGFKAVK